MSADDVLALPRTGLRGAVIRVVERLAEIGAAPGRSQDEGLRQGMLIFASVLIAVLSFIWVGAYLAYGHPRSAAIPATYQVVTVVGLVVLSRTRRFAVFRWTQHVPFLVLAPRLLPAPIAARLKRETGVIAEHHDAVTVLFADLVGFTARTEVMPPGQLVALLD